MTGHSVLRNCALKTVRESRKLRKKQSFVTDITTAYTAYHSTIRLCIQPLTAVAPLPPPPHACAGDERLAPAYSSPGEPRQRWHEARQQQQQQLRGLRLFEWHDRIQRTTQL